MDNVFCINLDRSADRWKSIRDSWREFDLTRVRAVDGFAFSSGDNDSGRPMWISDGERRIRGVSDFAMQHYDLLPTEAACNLSHVSALKRFIRTGARFGIIIEDDVEPAEGLRDFEFPDVDMFVLLGADHPGNRVRINDDGAITELRTLAAYRVSRRAAQIMAAAMFPLVYLDDFQISTRCIESVRRPRHYYPFDPAETFRAYAPRVSLVRHSGHALDSTFSRNGRKPWVIDASEVYQCISQ
jgi:hypothetical protein